jgi:hypothetical protein
MVPIVPWLALAILGYPSHSKTGPLIAIATASAVVALAAVRAIRVSVSADRHGLVVRNTLFTRRIAWEDVASVRVQYENPLRLVVGGFYRWPWGSQVVLDLHRAPTKVELQATFDFSWSSDRNERTAQQLRELWRAESVN